MFPNIVTKKDLTTPPVARKVLLIAPLLVPLLSRRERNLRGGEGSFDGAFFAREKRENGRACGEWVVERKTSLDGGKEGENEEEACAVETAKHVGNAGDESTLLDGCRLA